MIQQVLLFLEGKHDEVLKQLQQKMEVAAENLNFEEAARIRDRIKAVESILEKQRIISTEGQDDQDVIALASGDDETCALVFFFRSGKLIGREFFILQGTRESTPAEVMVLVPATVLRDGDAYPGGDCRRGRSRRPGCAASVAQRAAQGRADHLTNRSAARSCA